MPADGDGQQLHAANSICLPDAFFQTVQCFSQAFGWYLAAGIVAVLS